jgi:hypothetical protein
MRGGKSATESGRSANDPLLTFGQDSVSLQIIAKWAMLIRRRVWLGLEMMRHCIAMIFLLGISSACSEEAQDTENCALSAPQDLEGSALLVSGVYSDARLRIIVFQDRCSPALKNVYFKAEALMYIIADLSSMPGRRIDGLKIGIIDAELVPLTATNANPSDPLILVDRVYATHEFDDPQFVNSN